MGEGPQGLCRGDFSTYWATVRFKATSYYLEIMMKKMAADLADQEKKWYVFEN